MKNFLTIAVLFITVGIFAQTPETVKPVDPNGPVMLVDNETIDYGDAVRGQDDGIRVFKFKNTGKSPLTINVQSTCGCTVPSYPQGQIMPGDSGEIKVQYNMAPGRFSKVIKVTTNGSPDLVLLRIKGNILDPNAPVPMEQPKSMMSGQK